MTLFYLLNNFTTKTKPTINPKIIRANTGGIHKGLNTQIHDQVITLQSFKTIKMIARSTPKLIPLFLTTLVFILKFPFLMLP